MPVSEFDVPYLTHFPTLCRDTNYVLLTSEASGKYVPLQHFLLKPGMESPMQVQGQFQMTSHSKVCTNNLLVLHFILQSIDGIGSPASLLFQYMVAFIQPGEITYEEIVFNMETQEQVVKNG